MKLLTFSFIALLITGCSTHDQLFVKHRTGHYNRLDIDTAQLMSIARKALNTPEHKIKIANIQYTYNGGNIAHSFGLFEEAKEKIVLLQVYFVKGQLDYITANTQWNNSKKLSEDCRFWFNGLLSYSLTSQQMSRTPKHRNDSDTVMLRIRNREISFDNSGELKWTKNYNQLFSYKPEQILRYYKKHYQEKVDYIAQIWEDSGGYQKWSDMGAMYYRGRYPYYRVQSSVPGTLKQIGRIFDGYDGKLLLTFDTTIEVVM